MLVCRDVSVCIDAVGWGQRGGSNQAGEGVVVGSSGGLDESHLESVELKQKPLPRRGVGRGNPGEK